MKRTNSFLLNLLFIFYLQEKSNATCYCPYVCTKYGSYDGTMYCTRSGRSTCEDTEAHEECRAALHELTDMVNSIGSLATEFLSWKHDESQINANQGALLRTKLSEAFELEHKKPVPDCEVGLNTNTLAKGKGDDLCFSSELFDQCKLVQDKIDAYSIGIGFDLEELIRKDQRAVELGIVDGISTEIISGAANDFIKVIKERGALTTANIRCAAYEATIDEINSSEIRRKSSWSGLIIFLSVAAFFFDNCWSMCCPGI